MKDLHEMSSVDKLLYRIHTNRLRESIDPEVKVWVDRQLREHSSEIRRVSGDAVFQDFMLTYIKREQTKLQEPADSRRNPYGETRDRPLCTCGLECEIQSAEEPVEFKKHGDLDPAIRAFKRRHPGHPLVLDDAREAYYELVGDVEQLLRMLITALINKEIPEYGEDEQDLLDSLSDRRTNDNHDDKEEGMDVDEQVSQVASGDD